MILDASGVLRQGLAATSLVVGRLLTRLRSRLNFWLLSQSFGPESFRLMNLYWEQVYLIPLPLLGLKVADGI
jgi:hypothetical protein